MGKEERDMSMTEALAHGAAYPEVYICSPYAGDVEANVANAIRYARFALSEGFMPVVSHLMYPQVLDDSDPVQRDLGLAFGIRLMESCLGGLWVFADTDADISPGMAQEIGIAEKRGMRIRYFTTAFAERTEGGGDGEVDTEDGRG